MKSRWSLRRRRRGREDWIGEAGGEVGFGFWWLMRHLGGGREGYGEDIGGAEDIIHSHHTTMGWHGLASSSSRESRIRPDHAPESPQQIASMISPLSPPRGLSLCLGGGGFEERSVLGFGTGRTSGTRLLSPGSSAIYRCRGGVCVADRWLRLLRDSCGVPWHVPCYRVNNFYRPVCTACFGHETQPTLAPC